MNPTLLDRSRPAVRFAGPTAVLALVLFFAALGVHGDDVGAIARGPLGATSNVLALLSLLLLLAGLVQLARRPVLHDATGAVLLAGAGTVLVAGGAWAQLVLLPVVAVEAPTLADEGSGLLTAGYVVSFLVAALGWLLVALRLRRDPELSRGVVRLLLVGVLLMVTPLPVRWFLLTVAVTLLASEQPTTARSAATVPATG